MNTPTAVKPVWAQDAFLRGFWVATEETPEWIAAKVDALLTALGATLGVTAWATYKGDRWDGSLDNLADIVRRFVVRDRPTATDPAGEAMPEEGYSPAFSGSGREVAVDVRVAAGSRALAVRLPAHTLFIELRELVPGSLTSDVGDAVCAAVAATWSPANFKLTDSATNSTARRSNWKIGVGYRTWISSEVGTINEVAEGLSATELAGGTLISAPDDWTAERVVAAMIETLSANGLDEVAH